MQISISACNFHFLHESFEILMMWNLKVGCSFGFRSWTVTLSNWWPHIYESCMQYWDFTHNFMKIIACCMYISAFCPQLLKIARDFWKLHVNFDFLHRTFEKYTHLWKVARKFLLVTRNFQLFACNFSEILKLHGTFVNVGSSVMLKVTVHDLNPKLHATFKFHRMRISKDPCKKGKLRAKKSKVARNFQKLRVVSKSSMQLSKVACKKSKFTSNFQKSLAKSQNLHATFNFLHRTFFYFLHETFNFLHVTFINLFRNLHATLVKS